MDLSQKNLELQGPFLVPVPPHYFELSDAPVTGISLMTAAMERCSVGGGVTKEEGNGKKKPSISISSSCCLISVERCSSQF